MNRQRLKALLVSTLVVAAIAFGSSLTVPYTFTPGTTTRAADMNANFAAVKAAVDDNDARITALTAVSHIRAKTATAGSYASGATVIFGTEDYDSLGEYNPATGIFTATKAGVYAVSAAIFCNSLAYSASNSVASGLKKNGVTFAYGYRAFAPTAANWYLTSALQTTVSLAVGDTLSIFISHDRSGGNVTLFGDPAGNYFTVDRL